MIRSFQGDPHYLARYHEKWILGLLAVNAGLAVATEAEVADIAWYLPAILLLSSTRIESVLCALLWATGVSVMRADFEIASLAGLPAAVLFSLMFSGLLHCASHNAIRPRFLNRPAGELIGLFQLAGFPDWTVIHVLHHRHADDPERDPHPPIGKSYWEFTKGMRDSVLAAYLKRYFEIFGASDSSKAAVRRFARAMQADMLLRILFWFLLLGPQHFTFLFAFSVMFKMLHYAWFNHVTHQPSGIRNLGAGGYAWLNTLTFGLYYHGNHHRYPTVFDPRDLGEVPPPSPASVDSEAA